MKFESFSPADTEQFAAGLAEKAASGDIICLTGDLGGGKTAFARGFAAGLGISQIITSPTFILMNIYESGRLPLYHFDVYRLDSGEDFLESGCEEYLFGRGICLIEWADRISDVIPACAQWISLERDVQKGPDYRMILLKENEAENS